MERKRSKKALPALPKGNQSTTNLTLDTTSTSTAPSIVVNDPGATVKFNLPSTPRGTMAGMTSSPAGDPSAFNYATDLWDGLETINSHQQQGTPLFFVLPHVFSFVLRTSSEFFCL